MEEYTPLDELRQQFPYIATAIADYYASVADLDAVNDSGIRPWQWSEEVRRRWSEYDADMDLVDAAKEIFWPTERSSILTRRQPKVVISPALGQLIVKAQENPPL